MHRLANELVAEARENGCTVIAFEDLTDICERTGASWAQMGVRPPVRVRRVQSRRTWHHSRSDRPQEHVASVFILWVHPPGQPYRWGLRVLEVWVQESRRLQSGKEHRVAVYPSESKRPHRTRGEGARMETLRLARATHQLLKHGVETLEKIGREMGQ
jgi:hypothetical protein